MPPQGLLVLAAYLPAHWQVRFVDENLSSETKADFEGAEVVFVSGMHIQRQQMNDICRRAHEFDLFFFQAGDGIRAGRVTGVQTCALPISPPSPPPAAAGGARTAARRSRSPGRSGAGRGGTAGRPSPAAAAAPAARPSRPSPGPPPGRSEERRVGRECRTRGCPCGYNKIGR